MSDILEKVRRIEEKFSQIEEKLAQPDSPRDGGYAALLRERKTLVPLVEKYREYQTAALGLREAEELLSSSADAELRELAKEECRNCRAECDRLMQEMQLLLIPRDPDDDRNVILEIRAGAGGEEAALFAAVLFRMYSMYAASAGYRLEIVSRNETELGGFREVCCTVSGVGAFSHLKFESGVHRVQRVPVTEAQGRIQTSTVTVAVLPEAEDVEVEILPSDLVMESCKSSGAGGQHINKTESAVRLTHLPTGLVVECQEERSQYKNREKALHLLKSKLYAMKKQEQDEKIASQRRSQVGSGDRSERIRTYNYPQNRVTDHRLGLTLYNLDSFLNGNLSQVIDALLAQETAEKLKGEIV